MNLHIVGSLAGSIILMAITIKIFIDASKVKKLDNSDKAFRSLKKTLIGASIIEALVVAALIYIKINM